MRRKEMIARESPADIFDLHHNDQYDLTWREQGRRVDKTLILPIDVKEKIHVIWLSIIQTRKR